MNWISLHYYNVGITLLTIICMYFVMMKMMKKMMKMKKKILDIGNITIFIIINLLTDNSTIVIFTCEFKCVIWVIIPPLP